MKHVLDKQQSLESDTLLLRNLLYNPCTRVDAEECQFKMQPHKIVIKRGAKLGTACLSDETANASTLKTLQWRGCLDGLSVLKTQTADRFNEEINQKTTLRTS